MQTIPHMQSCVTPKIYNQTLIVLIAASIIVVVYVFTIQ